MGHIPNNISATVFHFLCRDCNQAVAEVTGPRGNRGGGYGLHVWTYKVHVSKLNDIMEVVEVHLGLIPITRVVSSRLLQ